MVCQCGRIGKPAKLRGQIQGMPVKMPSKAWAQVAFLHMLAIAVSPWHASFRHWVSMDLACLPQVVVRAAVVVVVSGEGGPLH